MKIKGYAIPKKNVENSEDKNDSEFAQKTCRILDINIEENQVTLLNTLGTNIKVFKLSDMEHYFKCSEIHGLLIPEGLNGVQETEYFVKVFKNVNNQKRDMTFVRKLLISQSLVLGRFCDSVYFNYAD